MDRQQLHEVRLRNLRKLVDERFDGSKPAFAAAIGRKRQQVYALMSDGTTHISLGNRLARHIESVLGLEPQVLDREGSAPPRRNGRTQRHGGPDLNAQQQALLDWWEWLLPAQREKVAAEILEMARANQEASRFFSHRLDNGTGRQNALAAGLGRRRLS